MIAGLGLLNRLGSVCSGFCRAPDVVGVCGASHQTCFLFSNDYHH